MQTKRIRGTLLGLVLAATLAVSPRPASAWVYTDNGDSVMAFYPAIDNATTMAIDPSGDIIAGGNIGVNPYLTDSLVVKLSGRLGAPTTLWETRLPTPYAVPASSANQVALDAQGNVAVAATSAGYDEDLATYHSQFQVVKLDGATGEILWEQDPNVNPTNNAGILPGAYAVAIDGDGNVIAVGQGDVGAGWSLVVMKFNGATGVELWRAGWTGGNSIAHSVAVDHAGNIVVGGWGGGATGGIVVKYDGATGAELWWKKKTLGNAGDFSYLAVDESDNIFAAATDAFQVMKLAPDGTIVWDQDLGGWDAMGRGVVIDGVGDAIAAGTISGAPGIHTVKFAGGDGAVVWQSLIDGSGFSSTCIPGQGSAVALDASGNPVVGGFDSGGTRPVFALFDLDATTGAENWRYLLDGAGTDDVGISGQQRANTVATDPLGNIIAAGSINPADGNYLDFTVVKLNPDGTDFVQLCGNGVTEGTETCDDGNRAAGDGCSATCQTEAGFLCQGEPSACVATIGVVPKKLLVLDKLAASGTAKTVFAAKDKNVSKGTGTDPTAISATFTAAYANGAARGGFTVPAGTGWLLNAAKVAKYVNKAAPAGPTQAKVALIRPGSTLSLTAKGIGDTPVDILAAGDPAGDVNTAYCVTNGGPTVCHCSVNQNCVFTKVAGDTGAKLVCKGGVADPTCAALLP